MADILLHDLTEEMCERLRVRAASNQRCVSAELREIVIAALTQSPPDHRAELKKLAADIRALSAARPQTPSEDLLRRGQKQ